MEEPEYCRVCHQVIDQAAYAPGYHHNRHMICSRCATRGYTDSVYVIRRNDPKPPMYYQGPTMDHLGRAYSFNPCYARKYDTEFSALRDAEKGEDIVHVRMVPV